MYIQQCNTLQHTVTNWNALPGPSRGRECFMARSASALSATPCNTLQQTATNCNTLQHAATHCNKLQHTATCCNTPGPPRGSVPWREARLICP